MVYAVVPIVPIASSGEYVGIEAIIVYIPIPAGPQSATIHDIPVERAAHGNCMARIAETDNTHSVLVVGLTAIEAIDPTLALFDAGKAQSIGVHPHGIALLGDEPESLITHGKLRYCVALLGEI